VRSNSSAAAAWAVVRWKRGARQPP